MLGVWGEMEGGGEEGMESEGVVEGQWSWDFGGATALLKRASLSMDFDRPGKSQQVLRMRYSVPSAKGGSDGWSTEGGGCQSRD